MANNITGVGTANTDADVFVPEVSFGLSYPIAEVPSVNEDIVVVVAVFSVTRGILIVSPPFCTIKLTSLVRFAKTNFFFM